MEFRILGPVEARADGRAFDLAGSRQRALLAALLLRRGAPVSRDRLAEDLWGEEDPQGAVNALQVAVSRLRRALGDEARRLVTTPHGYRLLIEPGELDLERFEALCEEGRRALAAGSAERAAARLRAALAEWRGPALADLSSEPFVPAEAARLGSLQAAAVEDRIEADLMAGRDSELLPELEALVAREPLRERLLGLLMLALYRAGRQGDALEAYRRAVRTLDAELGLRPGPELEQLERAILAHDPALRQGSTAEAPAAERRRATATLLFTDLAGSTRMRSELGDEDADAVRREHDRRLRDVLTLHGGRELKALGDGLMVAFESAGAAVACAVGMQRAIDRQAAPVPLGLRIGVAAGDVTWEDGDCFGMPVVGAQRLCEAAGGGQVLIADSVRMLAGDDCAAELEDAGELALKGFPTPMRAWQVRWTRSRSAVVPPAPALAVDAAMVLAGRSAELARLDAAWAAAVRGERQGVFVVGEPGIGKTRLAAELAARTPDAVVLYGRCDEGLATPAQPFAQALSAYVAACPVDELRVQLGGSGPHLLGLVPGLAARVPGIGEPAVTDPDLERLRTLDAATDLLAAAAAVTPVLLVLDDLHWADELSLHLLRHVLVAARPMRLLLVATYRDTEPARTALLGEITSGFARRQDVERIELGPLAERDVAAILADAGRARQLARSVRDATEGNPFFVGEVVHALADDGDPAATVTPRVRDVVRWRLNRLPAGAAELLATAAVTGLEFDADVVAAAARLDDDAALDLLEAAEAARLIRPAGALDRFAFTHALVRETIVSEVAAARRVRVHARVARALELAAGRRAVGAAELAAHFSAAGGLVDAADTIRYAVAAGDEAAAALAFDLAAAHYERALVAQSRIPEIEAADRLDLEIARGSALRMAGDERADSVLRSAAAGAEAAGDGTRMAEALLAIGLDLATDFMFDDREMAALLRRALELLPPHEDAVRARLLGYLAVEVPNIVEEPERRAMVEQALGLARASGDPVALASALMSHSWTVMGPESRQLRLQLADELVAGGDAGLPYAVSSGHVFRYIALVEAGDVEGADEALAAAHATARVPAARWTATVWSNTRLILAGRLDEAEQEAFRAAELARTGGFPPSVVRGTLAAAMWCIRVIKGGLPELGPLMMDRLAVLPARPAWTYIYEAILECERGDDDAAAAALEHALAKGLELAPRGLGWSSTMIWAADVCQRLGHQEGATRLHEVLSPFADVMVAHAGPISGSLARLELTLGRPEQAQRHYRAAIDLSQRMDARAYLAIARRELGLLLPTPEGQALMAAAETVGQELGLRWRPTAEGPAVQRGPRPSEPV